MSAKPPATATPASFIKPAVQDRGQQMVSGEGGDGETGEMRGVAATAAADGTGGKPDGCRTDADIVGKRSARVSLEEKMEANKVREERQFCYYRLSRVRCLLLSLALVDISCTPDTCKTSTEAPETKTAEPAGFLERFACIDQLLDVICEGVLSNLL